MFEIGFLHVVLNWYYILGRFGQLTVGLQQ